MSEGLMGAPKREARWGDILGIDDLFGTLMLIAGVIGVVHFCENDSISLNGPLNQVDDIDTSPNRLEFIDGGVLIAGSIEGS